MTSRSPTRTDVAVSAKSAGTKTRRSSRCGRAPSGRNTISESTLPRDAASGLAGDCAGIVHSWPVPNPRPVPEFIEDRLGLGQAISVIGKDLLAGIGAYAAHNNIEIGGL